MVMAVAVVMQMIVPFCVRIRVRSGGLATSIFLFHHHVMHRIVIIRIVHSAHVDFAISVREIVI